MTRRRKNKKVLKRNPTPSKLGADVVEHAQRKARRNDPEYQWDGFAGLRDYLDSSLDEKAEELLYAMRYIPDDMMDRIVAEIGALRRTQPELAAKAKAQLDQIRNQDEWDGTDQVEFLEESDALRSIAIDILALNTGYALEQMEDPEKPSWHFLDFRNAVAQPTWVVHCTNAEPYAVVNYFEGVDQIDKLGLTVHLDKGLWGTSDRGFGFAFEPDSFGRYAGDPCKYGTREVALKVARYVLAWHYTDMEPQVIFWGPDILEGFEVEHWNTRSGTKFQFPDLNLIESFDVEVPEPFDSLDDMAAWIDKQDPELREELYLKIPKKNNPRTSATSDLSKLKRRLMR